MRKGFVLILAVLVMLALSVPALAVNLPGKEGKPEKPNKAGFKNQGNRVPDYFGFPKLYKKAVAAGLVQTPLPRPLRLVEPQLSEDQWGEVKELEKALNKNREEGFYSILTKKQIDKRESIISAVRDAKQALRAEIAKKLDRFKKEDKKVKFYAKLLLKEKADHQKLMNAFHLAEEKLRREFKQRVKGLEKESEEFKKELRWFSHSHDALMQSCFPLKRIARFVHEEDFVCPHYFRQNVIMSYLGLTLEQKEQLKHLRQQWAEEREEALEQILTEKQYESLKLVRAYYHLLRKNKMEFDPERAKRIAQGVEKIELPEEGKEEKPGKPGKGEKPVRPGKGNKGPGKR